MHPHMGHNVCTHAWQHSHVTARCHPAFHHQLQLSLQAALQVGTAHGAATLCSLVYLLGAGWWCGVQTHWCCWLSALLSIGSGLRAAISNDCLDATANAHERTQQVGTPSIAYMYRLYRLLNPAACLTRLWCHLLWNFAGAACILLGPAVLCRVQAL
jgi:hypothetical protein